MNSTFPTLLQHHLHLAIPTVQVRCAAGTEDLTLPYAVLSITGEQEIIPRNHTWELSVGVELHASAYDTPEQEQQALFRNICAALADPKFTDTLNAEATDFYLYSLRLQAVDEPQVQDKTHVQTARFRAIIQF